MNRDPDRATQFLAFAALSGFERLLEEREKEAQQQEARQNAARPAAQEFPLPEDDTP